MVYEYMNIKEYCQDEGIPFEECRIFFELSYGKWVEVKNNNEIQNEDCEIFESKIIHPNIKRSFKKKTKFNKGFLEGTIPYATEEQLRKKILSSREELLDKLMEDDKPQYSDDHGMNIIIERNYLAKYVEIYNQHIEELGLE